MSHLTAVGTYLPVWGTGRGRELGPDEDAVTIAVAAARAALSTVPAPAVRRVVFVTRDMPLLEGGNGAVLLAGIGLSDDVPLVENLGGAPAVLDALVAAGTGTLVVTADVTPAGAGAIYVGDDGPELTHVAGIQRSLPIHVRDQRGGERDYEDARLQRERGLGVSLDQLDLPGKPSIVAGVAGKQAAALTEGRPPTLPTVGASSAVFALAAAEQVGPTALIVAVEQATATAVRLDGVPAVTRDEAVVRPPAKLTWTPGADISISLPAYERAFEPKVRWEAGRCAQCGTLAFPPRRRCLGCGAEAQWSLTPLPRAGSVYTVVTVRVPVPGLPTPYSLAIIELGDEQSGEVGVRALVKVTGVEAGTVKIDDRGSLVLRRVAERSGVPDYGYAFLPDPVAGSDERGESA